MHRNDKLKSGLVGSRSTGQALIGNQHDPNKGENPEVIKAQIDAFTKFKTFTQNEKDRLNDLMQRKSAQKWDAKKKNRMVRKYMLADQAITEAADAIDQLQFRLSQITTAAA